VDFGGFPDNNRYNASLVAQGVKASNQKGKKKARVKGRRSAGRAI